MTDILAIGAHPDDVELGVGATLALAAARGHQVVIIDLTRGELASRGTPEIRVQEAYNSAQVLGVTERINGEWADGSLGDPNLWWSRIQELVGWIRHYCPQLVMAPGGQDRHPDHGSAGRMARDACFYSGLAKFPGSPLAPWRPARFFTYRINASLTGEEKEPILMDVSSVYAQKQEALRQYESQFFRGDKETRKELRIPDLPTLMEDRDRYLGGTVGVQFAEPLFSDGPLLLDQPAMLWK